MDGDVRVIEHAYGMLRYADGHAPVKGHLHMVLWADYKRAVDALAAKDEEHRKKLIEVVRQSQAIIEQAERTEARLAEAYKALEPFALAASAYLIEELDDEYRPDWSPFIPYGAYRAARRVLTQKEPK